MSLPIVEAVVDDSTLSVSLAGTRTETSFSQAMFSRRSVQREWLEHLDHAPTTESYAFGLWQFLEPTKLRLGRSTSRVCTFCKARMPRD